jgi:hypothetical protein
MRTLALAGMMIAVLAAPALAQQRGPMTTRTDEQKKTDADIDRAYQRAVKSTGDKGKAAPTDPWQTVRPPSNDKR